MLNQNIWLGLESPDKGKPSLMGLERVFSLSRMVSHGVPGTSPKDVMDMVMLTQYFDTMRDIGSQSKSNAIFIPHGPGAVGDIAEQIRNGWLQGNVAASNNTI